MQFSRQQLNIARQHLLDQIIDYFLAKEGVEALYIQGSVAAGTTDEFSDIDVRVVIHSNFYEKLTSERFSAPKQWGDWIYNEWSRASWVCVSHFKPFNKVDVLYLKPEHLQPSPWYLEAIQIVYDPKKLVQEVIEASQEMEPTFKEAEVDWLISKGLAHAEEIYRQAMRYELFYGQSLLDSFRKILIKIDDTFQQNLSPSDPTANVKQRNTPELIEVLKHSYPPLEQKQIINTLSDLLRGYRNQIIKCHEMFSLERDQKTDIDCIDTMLELCQTELSK